MKNFEAQIFPKQTLKMKSHSITTIFTTDAATKKLNTNIQMQVEMLDSCHVLSVDSEETSLHHLFKPKNVTPEQTNDLMNFREIGQSEFERRVEYYTLCNPSVKPPKRRKRLLTFTERKSRQKKVSEIDR